MQDNVHQAGQQQDGKETHENNKTDQASLDPFTGSRKTILQKTDQDSHDHADDYRKDQGQEVDGAFSFVFIRHGTLFLLSYYKINPGIYGSPHDMNTEQLR